LIVRLNAGLGNQLFQWAFGRCVSLVRNEELFFEKYNLNAPGHRAYSLDAFNLDLKFCEPNGAPLLVETDDRFGFIPEVYAAPKGTHYIGNWQTEKYFIEPLIRRKLMLDKTSFTTDLISKQIRRNTPSALIHVRRTDYLIPSTAEYHGNVSLEYYKTAMNIIREVEPHVTFFVFSDDPAWCREAFPGCIVVGHNKPGSGESGPGREHEDLYLMSLCDHAIIPNSSFGWWGAWLRPWHNDRSKITIAPKVWFRKEGLRSEDIVPDRWIRL
jgi:hypothetical protein